MSPHTQRIRTWAAAHRFDLAATSLNKLNLLFQATYRVNSVEIRLAKDSGLVVIAACVLSVSARNLLNTWSLVAIGDLDGHGTEVHALDWRVALRNAWSTSVRVGADLLAQVASTRSGHVYRLGTEDVPELIQSLGDHLVHALHTRGFSDVGP